MEPSKEAIAVRITRLNRQIVGKVTSGVVNKFNRKTVDREALLDALTVLYDECNDDPVKKTDELVRSFVDKYRSTLAELRRTRVCIADFDIIQTIGRGHFGDVHMVREKQTSDVYALKIIKKELARKRAASAEDERDVLANANVAWIPKLQYAFQDNSHLYLVMELCSGGDLAGLIARRHNPLSEKDAAFYVAEVAHALKALHGMGYVHRDVKPHNIFLDRCGHIKLGDFGSCARLSSDAGGAGAATADYVAPELLAAADCADNHATCMRCCEGIHSNALSACDYWSLGVIAYELVTLRRPFSSGDDDTVPQILSNIQKYERSCESGESPCPAGLESSSVEWRSLVRGLLAVRPTLRYNYLDTLQHAAMQHLSLHNIRDQVRSCESGESPCPAGLESSSVEWRSLVRGLLAVRPTLRYNYLDTLQHAAMQHLSLHNIRDQVRSCESGESPCPAGLESSSVEWRSLVRGLLAVRPTLRYNYLDTLQHAAMQHLSLHNIRDQVRSCESGESPCPAGLESSSVEWRSLVRGLLAVRPTLRYNYLDTLQHAAMQHLSLHNIRDQVRSCESGESPCPAGLESSSVEWRSLVRGLLAVRPTLRYNYLDTLQHAAMQHLSLHNIRDQVRSCESGESPCPAGLESSSVEWRSLVRGLLAVRPTLRYNYLDTLQHAAMQHLSLHNIRDQVRSCESGESPCPAGLESSSVEWRSLVRGLLAVRPTLRYNYLDTLQHAAMQHLSLHNIRDQVRSCESGESPCPAGLESSSVEWRSLVRGLLAVRPTLRYNYLDTLQHAAMQHLSLHNIRDQVRSCESGESPCPAGLESSSVEWRSLVRGLLAVRPTLRYNYLDTLQHAAMQHLSLHNIRDQVRSCESGESPCPAGLESSSVEWRSLVRGLLAVRPTLRYNYLDTLQHAAMQHLSLHNIRDQVRSCESGESPCPAGLESSSVEWRSLVRGLLAVRPTLRYNYLDTLQHAAMQHLSLHNIRDQVRSCESGESPCPAGLESSSVEWRSLVRGLLAVRPTLRYNYLDTLQHAAMQHLSLHNIRDQVRSCESGESPCPAGLESSSVEWRSLVRGLLAVRPTLRYNYLDTLQHAAMQHLSLHNIRDQVRSCESGESPCPAGLESSSVEWRSLVRGLLAVRPTLRYNYLDTLQHAAMQHLSLHNIRDQVRSCESGESPCPAGLESSSVEWRSLVRGLLAVRPTLRYNYLDTLQHAAMQHLSLHNIRDQSPAWVPLVRGSEDASYFSVCARAASPPDITAFRGRQPFAGQLPFVGYSYVAPEDTEEHSGGFTASLDCTAIDLATYKSAEKLAALRGREVAALQSQLAEAHSAASAAAEKARELAAEEAERARVALQAEITALALQNKRLERQVEVEREERMALQRSNQQLSANIADRNSAELKAARAQVAVAQSERDVLSEEVKRLEAQLTELRDECRRAAADAEHVRQQQQHYKDTIAKERALRRQTLTGSEAESREAQSVAAAAAAEAARERGARELLQARLHEAHLHHADLSTQLQHCRDQLTAAQQSLEEKARNNNDDRLAEVQRLLAQEQQKTVTLTQEVQELQSAVSAARGREAALEEQGARTEARLRARLEDAEAGAAAAADLHTRHRDKVNTLEQLVRQLEREVSALEKRTCPECEARHLERIGDREIEREEERRKDTQSDTESVTDAANVQLMVMKEQLERAEAQLQARADEMAALRQETKTANLARWRKEREYNELQTETKSTARDLKRVEDRLTTVLEARKSAELKLATLEKEIAKLRPDYEKARQDADMYKEKFDKLHKVHETIQVEVDRSRNDIRKLKSELQYSEKRRLHAEEQEEMSSRERCQLRDELGEVRAVNADLVQNNKMLQEACTMLEDQLTDLEKLTDLNELKNKDLDAEMQRLRSELESCRSRLSLAERGVAERSLEAALVSKQHDEVSEQAKHAYCQMQILSERLEHRECQISELESRVLELETERGGLQAALNTAMRRVRDLQEENSSLRTRAHEHHTHAMQLQANLSEAQEELSCAREAAESAAAWWRTRETKADATLRQQAKLIDFLQVKVEEMGRKKHSLSNKLFGRSGRRPVASPPLRRANRELREEVERLRARLAEHNSTDAPTFRCPTTPKRELCTPKSTKKHTSVVKSPANSVKNLEKTSSSNRDENNVLVVWNDGTRESMHASCSTEGIVLSTAEKQLKGKLLSTEPKNLPYNEANRAFSVRLENGSQGSEADVICEDSSEKSELVSSLSCGYQAVVLRNRADKPHAALCVSVNAVAIGYSDGLHSIRGAVCVSLETPESPPRGSTARGATRGPGRGLVPGAVTALAAVHGRALFIYSGMLVHTGLLALGSAVRRASNLKPSLNVDKVKLPDSTQPHLIKVSADAGACAVAACGRRVCVLRWAAEDAQFKVTRTLTVDRAPADLLLVRGALYIAGEKPLKINLPAGALETFAIDEPTVSAAAKKHSPPMAILLIQDNPIEILLCYAECGIFVDEHGKRTRSEDPKWTTAVKKWEFVKPFLYLVGEDRVTILYITEEVYRAPPCTCDTTSITSSQSESYSPQIYSLKIREPDLLGTVPNGIIVSTKTADGYNVSVVEGLPAFKSIGASVESLITSSSVGSNSSINDYESEKGDQEINNDISQESVEVSTGFLADIRKRARQLRAKNKNGPMPDEVIKEILTAEVGLKTSNGRKSPASITESETDTETDEKTITTKGTADVCGEMFARQVRFQ